MNTYHAKCRTADCCLSSGAWIAVSEVKDWINKHVQMYGHKDIEFQEYIPRQRRFRDLPLSL